MEVRRDIVIEALNTLHAAADRLEVLEFHGQSARIVTSCRALERSLAKACSDADRLTASRIEPELPDPDAWMVFTREALRTVLREELRAVIGELQAKGAHDGRA